MRLTLNKRERLKSRKLIDELFANGNAIDAYPIKLVFKEITAEQSPHAPVLFGVTVSKKRFKRAVDRNLIKRRLRESFRINKVDLCNHLISADNQVCMMAIYISRDILDYKTIESAMLKLQRQLINLY